MPPPHTFGLSKKIALPVPWFLLGISLFFAPARTQRARGLREKAFGSSRGLIFGISSDTQNNGSKKIGKISEHFSREICSSKKIFRANLRRADTQTLTC